MSAPSADLIPRLEVGDPAWLATMSASKVASVVGLSPYQSRYSLYWQMAGRVADEPNVEMTRGVFLEDGIVDWFAHHHPDLLVERTGTWRHRERPWQTATPDRLLWDADGNAMLLEAKTSSEWEPWGPDGSEEIPIWYRCQVQWQLDTLGLDACYVVVLMPYLSFRTYRIGYDPEDAAVLRDAAAEFLADLDAGRVPNLDDHDETYRVVRALHPDIDDEDIEIPASLAAEYRAGMAAWRAGNAAKASACSAMLAAMGSARYAVADGERVAVRVPSPKKGHPPYVKPSSGAAPPSPPSVREALAALADSAGPA